MGNLQGQPCSQVIVLSAKICFQQQTIHKFDPLTLFSFN